MLWNCLIRKELNSETPPRGLSVSPLFYFINMYRFIPLINFFTFFRFGTQSRSSTTLPVYFRSFSVPFTSYFICLLFSLEGDSLFHIPPLRMGTMTPYFISYCSLYTAPCCGLFHMARAPFPPQYIKALLYHR